MVTLPQNSSITQTTKSSSMEYSQQNILVVSQPSSCVSSVSDTQTTFSSSATTLSTIEYSTTSSSVDTSISGHTISTITTTAGTYVHTVCMYAEHMYIH